MVLASATQPRHFISLLLIGFFTMIVLYCYSTNARRPSRFAVLPRSPPKVQSTTKYLTYLPHSGLSNQRIELANALLMASVLERTLIIPPAFIGRVMSWHDDRRTRAQMFEWLTIPKDFDTICTTTHDPQQLFTYVESSKCQDYHDIGAIRWSELHNLEILRPYVSFQYSNVVSLDHLTSSLDLCNHGDDDCKDIYVHYDKLRYDWRVYENDKVRHELYTNQRNFVYREGKKEFYQLTSWADWQNRPEKLLYLDSIFGTTRLNVVHPDHVALKHRIMEALIYRMDSSLGETVSLIVKEHLGNSAYLAVHFRTADKPFMKGIDMQLQNTSLEIEHTLSLHRRTSSFCQFATSTIDSTDNNATLVNIYMATDQSLPKDTNSPLAPWFERYPCTITLNDIPSSYFKTLENIYDLVHPTKSLKRFLIPLVDSMVAAHGSQVYLTPGSTFSGYIGQLHHAWLQDSRINVLPLF